MATRRYKAFISYSHRDKRVANWLHGQLENFRVPEGIDAPGLEDGLRPVFKDREELPASEDLGAALEEAIRNSDALIVLCSPHSAISPWIAKEIDLFKRVNGDARVFPAVVDGDPPYNMPPPLLVHYEDGTPTEELAEPIAADLRPEVDGRKLGVQKLVAGLIGVGLDELVDRQARQRNRRMALIAAASFIGMVVAIAMALYALQQRDTARAERAEANGLIEYMLTDLREELEPVGRLDLLDSVGERAMDYYASQDLEDLSAEELARRARAVQLVAEMHNLRGDNDKALPAFRQAARTTQELIERNPNDTDALFAHGQSLYWVGYIAWQRGDTDAARESLEGYARISTRLAEMDRSNLDWQMEESYALSNLGTLAFDGGDYETALPLFERSVETVERVAVAEGRPAARLIEWGEGISWVASTQNSLGDFSEAQRTLEQEIALYEEALKKAPRNSDALRPLVFARQQLGWLLAATGKQAQARRALDNAAATAENLLAQDSENTWTIEMAISALGTRAMLNWTAGRDAEASADFDRAQTLLADLQGRDAKNVNWNVERPATLELSRGLTDRANVPPAEHLRLARRWIDRLDEGDAPTTWPLVAAHLIEASALQRMGDRAAAAAAYARAIALEDEKAGLDVNMTALRAVAAERLGQGDLARQLRQKLAEKGISALIDKRIAI
ncbi:toll/interleukin-1 receptor domain-containing protein [Qipengyuania aquimaris]|uniref:toll/interleukin-1 receptor domain-containing protein n=1 Tax=Qipengyuania aquimaris TaxID=255984 RepID=UPI001FD038BA|nr:toll/interleukin-1 receptor domain-containing protein [Qipengyuania aquimaris]UOR15972.1 TIR domain-containing protein [Qipengyuania aquimaris]